MGVETTKGLTFALVTYYKKMPNPTSKIFDKILSFDPLDAAERLTGSSYKESPGTVSLGMAMAQEHNRLKSHVLSEANDRLKCRRRSKGGYLKPTQNCST
jgi:hypothetical protein